MPAARRPRLPVGYLRLAPSRNSFLACLPQRFSHLLDNEQVYKVEMVKEGILLKRVKLEEEFEFLAPSSRPKKD